MKSPKSLPKPKKRSKGFMIRRVSGESMIPALLPGQVIIATRRIMSLKEGDVVVLVHDQLEKIKRIREIKDGQFFVLGDNPVASTDSRTFGWLERTHIVAKVCWPRKV